MKIKYINENQGLLTINLVQRFKVTVPSIRVMQFKFKIDLDNKNVKFIVLGKRQQWKATDSYCYISLNHFI